MSDAEQSTERREGRYLYCVVRVDRDDPSVDVSGVEGTDLTLVVAGDLAAAVHPRATPYESDVPSEVREWLLAHQSAVEAVGEAFGTPVPFRFDTVVEGDDEAVRAWLRERRDELTAALDTLAGHWEYRIELSWDETAVADDLTSSDEKLRELAAKRDDASEGVAFLVEKQYEKRRDELLEQWRRSQRRELASTLEEHVAAVEELGDAPETALTETTDAPTVRLAVLADDEGRDAVGDYLDEVLEDPAVSVTYTGPWPPYTFAPDLAGAVANREDTSGTRPS
jgi:hypothetical protein